MIATGRGIASARSYIGEAVERAGIMLRARAEKVEQGAWPPDSQTAGIWLDEVTAGLLDARFRVARTDEGIVVYSLEGEEPSFDPSRRLLGRPTACVGREHELGMLDLARRACVEEASPRAMLVLGPPGIGKSRVRYEFLRRIRAQDEAPEVLLGLGDPIRTAATRGMLAGALLRACAAPESTANDTESAVAREAAFARRIGRHLTHDVRRTCAFLGELCGVRFSDEELPELRAARQNPSIMTDAITTAWLTFVRAECAAQPLVLVLDDLQWADALSVSLAGTALRELAESPLFVLALGRPETLELFPELWAPRLATLPLQPLSAAATRRLVRQALGEKPSAQSVERIVQRAGGNALFLEELIRAADGRRDAIPQTVLAMLQARIGLLPAPLRRVLRAASVLGEYFPAAGVDALLAEGPAELDLAATLASLNKQEILEPQSEERGVARWRFRHALMRDAAYALLTDEEQTGWHGEAARYCERAGDDSAVIASHCERGHDLAGAVKHYAAAAEQAYRHNELGTALALVERGLRCGPTGEARGVLRGIEVPARFYTHDFAGSWAASAEVVAALAKGHPKRLTALAYATFVASQLGKLNEARGFIDELLSTRPTPDEYSAYSSALGYASISYVVQAKRPEAERFVARLEDLERQVGEGDPFIQGHVLYWRLRAEVMLGDDPFRAYELGVRCAPVSRACGRPSHARVRAG